MTPFVFISPQWRVVVLFFLLSNAVLSLFLVIYEYILERKRTEMVIDLSYLLLSVLLASSFKTWHEAICMGRKISEPAIPFICPVILGIAGSLYALIRMNRMRKRSNTGISKKSIRESIDNLPSGIGFFDENGLPYMLNHQMHILCYFMLGRDVQSVDELRLALKHPAEGTMILEPDTGLYRLPDGGVWRFTENVVTTENGGKFTRFLAADVQKLYESQKELEDDNRKLREVAESMKELSKNILAVTREEETLAMKMRVHDDLGHSVLATQRQLVRGYTEEEAALLLQQWRNVLNLLRRDNEAAVSLKWMDLLEKRAGILGLKLCYQGNFPVDETCAKILASAIQECMTNGVRHARATEIKIVIEEDDQKVSSIITNNGRIPTGEIVEGGGLSGLRSKVEGNGGSMSISSHPEFSLKVVIPKKEEVL